MNGWIFSEALLNTKKSGFEKMIDIFLELLVYASGDINEALKWLTELDKEYEISDKNYGIADFVEDLYNKGYIKDNQNEGGPSLTPKSEGAIRKNAYRELFGNVKKAKKGDHNTKATGRSDEHTSELKPYFFGDKIEDIDVTQSIKNAHINHGIEDFTLSPDDLEVKETYYQSQMSTVLMIDISHSMILYGEDRITPAKNVAMALSEHILQKFKKDTLDIIVFGDDARQIQIKDLPYLEVGPYHTNTVAGLELAYELLRKRKNPNKQVFMITDGKPTCIKIGKKYYKNSFGLDRKIINRTFQLASRFKKADIPITTFMIARDPFLVNFVKEFTEINGGTAFYSDLDHLGNFIFNDYIFRKKRK